MKKKQHCTITYRDFKNLDEPLFLKDLFHVPCDFIKLFEDPNDSRSVFNDLFFNVVEQHAPLKNRVRIKPIVWINSEILELI